jgi:hypothetical protein
MKRSKKPFFSVITPLCVILNLHVDEPKEEWLVFLSPKEYKLA